MNDYIKYSYGRQINFILDKPKNQLFTKLFLCNVRPTPKVMFIRHLNTIDLVLESDMNK